MTRHTDLSFVKDGGRVFLLRLRVVIIAQSSHQDSVLFKLQSERISITHRSPSLILFLIGDPLQTALKAPRTHGRDDWSSGSETMWEPGDADALGSNGEVRVFVELPNTESRRSKSPKNFAVVDGLDSWEFAENVLIPSVLSFAGPGISTISSDCLLFDTTVKQSRSSKTHLRYEPRLDTPTERNTFGAVGENSNTDLQLGKAHHVGTESRASSRVADTDQSVEIVDLCA